MKSLKRWKVVTQNLPGFFFLGVAESVVDFFGVVSVGRALPVIDVPFFLGDLESKHKFLLAFSFALEVDGPDTLSNLTLDAGFLTTTAAAFLPFFFSLLCPFCRDLEAFGLTLICMTGLALEAISKRRFSFSILADCSFCRNSLIIELEVTSCSV